MKYCVWYLLDYKLIPLQKCTCKNFVDKNENLFTLYLFCFNIQIFLTSTRDMP